MSDSIKSAVGTVLNGSLASIGATALQITSTATPLKWGVRIKAAHANSTNFIYVGCNSTLTAGVAAPTTDGYQLALDTEVFIPIDDLSKIWVIGSTTGLVLTWIAA